MKSQKLDLLEMFMFFIASVMDIENYQQWSPCNYMYFSSY